MDIGMLKPAVSDMWVWVLDDASTPEIENVLNFSLRGCSCSKKLSKNGILRCSREFSETYRMWNFFNGRWGTSLSFNNCEEVPPKARLTDRWHRFFNLTQFPLNLFTSPESISELRSIFLIALHLRCQFPLKACSLHVSWALKYGAKPSRPAKIVPPFTMALLTWYLVIIDIY